MLSFFDDQTIISNTEDDSQKAGCKLNQTITEHSSTKSVE